MEFKRPKIAVIGCGQIGGVAAQLLVKRELGDVIMLDIVEGMPQGKALDIYEASRTNRSDVSVKGTNEYKDIEGSDVIIVTSGIARKPGMSRDDLIGINAGIIKTTAENIKKYAPNSYVIVISNPLDAMVTLMQKVTGFSTNRVFGQAGILDSSRFASFIAWELGISVKDVNALVLGGHGDTMVPITRLANVAGISAMALFEQKYKSKEKAQEVMDAIVKRTAFAGGEVLELLKTGSAFYSPAASSVEMAEALIRDQKRVIPACAYLQGEYGINGFYAGVPVVVGGKGVERIVEFELNDEEKDMFYKSVNAVKPLLEIMRKQNILVD